MGAPPSTTLDPTMSATANKTWKTRFAGGRRSESAERAIEVVETPIHTHPLKSVPSASNTVPVEGSDSVAKSLRYKKKMSGRFRHLIPSIGKPKDISTASDASPSNPQTPKTDATCTLEGGHSIDFKESLFQWQDEMEQRRDAKVLHKKALKKERDGFCRTVDSYDGSVIVIDGKPTYELGNYLGGGVAGVVYEGNRLLPTNQYPVRTGIVVDHVLPVAVVQPRSAFSCLHVGSVLGETNRIMQQRSIASAITANTLESPPPTMYTDKMATEDVAIETTDDGEGSVLVDRPDAPSRSNAATVAALSASQWFMEETVAIKILNPVGFRLLAASQTKDAVVVKTGAKMSQEVQKGNEPMQEKHVWWLVNPSSRNLQTLQRYNQKNMDGNIRKTRDVDRGTQEKGLRLSLIAAYVDTKGNLRELPLTRCIEVWGHVPFGTSDDEFENMMDAIERLNAGQPPLALPPSRQTTSTTASSKSLNEYSTLSDNVSICKERTGLFRAVVEERSTVFCDSLQAFIALPAVPPKYLRWLRQRRAATKEIRNMMLIGRHRNVVHLYEVLEYIEEAKSTMFLVLELVRGGELFDLISSGANSDKRGYDDCDTEKAMRKYFQELASGIHYCHANGIAHRDLKPENLLVHNGPGTESTLKIADFGLSAVFDMSASDQDTVLTSLAASLMGTPSRSPNRRSGYSDESYEAISDSVHHSKTDGVKSRSNSFQASMSALGATALTFLTCGAVEDVAWCGPADSDQSSDAVQVALRRMTSVVGSPHYVAPEIIMQTDEKDGRKKKNAAGYDGTKADVWSAGVILYAMLFRSLPFGEDLLRCPRYKSFRKWYTEASSKGTRRSTGLASLNPYISAADQADQLGPHWFFPSTTSPESRDLIVAMLNPDPDERLSIAMVLQHPWIINMPEEVEFRKFDEDQNDK